MVPDALNREIWGGQLITLHLFSKCTIIYLAGYNYSEGLSVSNMQVLYNNSQPIALYSMSLILTL